MDFVRTWTLSIAGLVLIASVVEILMPQVQLKKYANLTLGFLIITTLIRPIVALSSTDILLNDFQFEFYSQEVMTETRSEQLANTFSRRLESDIEARLTKNFGRLNADVEISFDDDNTIVLDRVIITNSLQRHRREIENELTENYGFDIIEFR